MGLDGVELIIRIEHTFQVSITDLEATRARTVGDLYDLIWVKVARPRAAECLTSKSFYRVRRGLMEVLGVPRKKIHPTTRLQSLFSSAERSKQWHRVAGATGLTFPGLMHPRWLQSTLVGLGLVLPLFFAWKLDWGSGWSIFVCFAGFVFGAVLATRSSRFATDFPAVEMTVGDLARIVLANNAERFAEGRLSEPDVWETLCTVIAEQQAIDRSEIRREASLTEDLKID